MAMFKAFKPEAMNKIAKAMGYSGDMGQFQQYIEDDPARKAAWVALKSVRYSSINALCLSVKPIT